MKLKTKMVLKMVFTLWFISCKAPDSIVHDISFITLDQFGNAISDAEIIFNGEKSKTNEEGKCVYKLKPGKSADDKIMVTKEGYDFLGPMKISSLNPDIGSIVITLFRNYTLTLTASVDNAPSPGITILIDGISNEIGSNGLLKKDFSGERTESFIVSASSKSAELDRARLPDEQSIPIEKNKFTYSWPFEFFRKMAPPPDSSDTDNNRGTKPVEKATITIISTMSAIFTIDDYGPNPKSKQEIQIPSDMRSLTAYSQGRRVNINLDDIKPNKNYKYEINFLTGTSRKID